ncbi:MAG: hypothetical protein IT422_28610 [Pirellulaceae bacterium]|nr:hypothetical protein [Pirellulaceae bacterium]
MLKKIVSIVSVVALTVAFVGCDAGAVADKAKEGVDTTAGAGHDAAGEVVPDAAKEHVDGAIDSGSDKAKEAIDAAAE